MQQIHKSKSNKNRNQPTNMGCNGQVSNEVKSIYLPGLPVCFASKGQEATENGSKTENQSSC